MCVAPRIFNGHYEQPRARAVPSASCQARSSIHIEGRSASSQQKQRLPILSWETEFVTSGALMSYGQDNSEAGRRAAGYVYKILKGAKPADLPVEQPTRFQLTINAKAAKALGLTIPPSVLLQADRVIE